MKLFDSGMAPNPRRVRIFLAEKGLPVPERVDIDIMKLAHKSPEFAGRNPWTRIPVLELDDGTAISESIAICRYFEELHPDPALFGVGAKGRALVEMWNRRMEMGLLLAIASAFRHLHPRMAALEAPQVKEFGEACRPKAIEQIELLDAALKDREFVAGDALTIADITAGVALDMLGWARIEMPPAAMNARRWHDALKARPSWTA
jgi:glutathione S-transferase